jgi:hypothetical protein
MSISDCELLQGILITIQLKELSTTMKSISKESQSLAEMEIRSTINYVRCIITPLLDCLSGKCEDNLEEENMLI